jgi:hypothetical protein
MVHVLELEVSRGSGRGDYVVQVVRSPAGEASATFTLDSDRLLDERPNLQNALLLSSVSSRRAAASGNEGLVQAVGRELFDAVFGPKAIAGLYAASRALADSTQEELRIVLRTESPELAALPWEIMYDSDSDAYVCRREPLVRHVPVASAPAPLRVRGAVRILGVVSSPRGMAVLDVDKEKDNLTSALAGPAKRGLVDLQWAPDASWSTLQELLLSEEWHVIHFIGHGDFDFERQEGILALVGKDGRANRVEGSRFVDLLRQARPMPRLVVLNSCSSATSSSQDLFSGTAAALVRGGVSAVAAMQFEITDGAAIEFCRGFYNAVAHGRGVDEAVGSGRVAILGSSGETLEWVTPVLYLRGLDSQLFAVESAAAGAAPVVSSTEERVAQAQDAIDHHDPATAIPVLDTVLADDPENEPAQELRGVAVEDVMREVGAAKEQKPDDVEASPAALAADHAQSLARLEKKAKEIRWTLRPWKADMNMISELLDPAETLLGVCRITRTFATSFTLVVTERYLYLSGAADDGNWQEARNGFPATFQLTEGVVRIPLEQVESCEITADDVFTVKGRGFAVSFETFQAYKSLALVIDGFMVRARRSG